MSWFLRLLVFLPAVYLVMVVYSAPNAIDARGVAEIAARKTVRVLIWTVVMIVVMFAMEWMFLP